jgi:excisionase family DNA binding protein
MPRRRTKTKQSPAWQSALDALAARLGALEARVEALQALVEEKRLGAARWLTKRELAGVTGLSTRTLDRMVKDRRVRSHQIGGSVRFSPEDVSWLEEHLAVLPEEEGA